MAYRVVDEGDFTRDFHKKIEGTLAVDEKKRAGKRLSDLRSTILYEGQQLKELGERLHQAQHQV